MKVEAVLLGQRYNMFGCGYRILFLIKYNRKRWVDGQYERGDESIALNRRLNKLVMYWNYHGNKNGRDMIIRKEMFVPIDTIGGVKKLMAIPTKNYGFIKPNRSNGGISNENC